MNRLLNMSVLALLHGMDNPTWLTPFINALVLEQQLEAQPNILKAKVEYNWTPEGLSFDVRVMQMATVDTIVIQLNP